MHVCNDALFHFTFSLIFSGHLALDKFNDHYLHLLQRRLPWGWRSHCCCAGVCSRSKLKAPKKFKSSQLFQLMIVVMSIVILMTMMMTMMMTCCCWCHPHKPIHTHPRSKRGCDLVENVVIVVLVIIQNIIIVVAIIAMIHYDPLRSTVIHYDPLWTKIIQIPIIWLPLTSTTATIYNAMAASILKKSPYWRLSLNTEKEPSQISGRK